MRSEIERYDRGIDDRGRVEKRDRAFVAGFSREQKKRDA